MIWRGSRNQGKRTEIFTGVLFNGYAPPEGFCFDEIGDGYCKDPSFTPENLQKRIKQFVEKTCAQASKYRTNNIMLTMGGDFNYHNAPRWFSNLDILIKNANKVSDHLKNIANLAI